MGCSEINDETRTSLCEICISVAAYEQATQPVNQSESKQAPAAPFHNFFPFVYAINPITVSLFALPRF